VKQKTKGNRQCSERNKKQSINWEEQLTKGLFNWQREGNRYLTTKQQAWNQSIHLNGTTERWSYSIPWTARRTTEGLWFFDGEGIERDREIKGLTAEGLTDCGSSTAKDWGIVGLRDGEIDRLEIKDWRIRDWRTGALKDYGL
jgi:hypothetical protein